MWRTAVSILLVAAVAVGPFASAADLCGGSIDRADARGDVLLWIVEEPTEEPAMDTLRVGVRQEASEIVLDLTVVEPPHGAMWSYRYTPSFVASPDEWTGYIIEFMIEGTLTYDTAIVRAYAGSDSIPIGSVPVAWDGAHAEVRMGAQTIRDALSYDDLYIGVPSVETEGPFAITAVQFQPTGAPYKVDHHTSWGEAALFFAACA